MAVPSLPQTTEGCGQVVLVAEDDLLVLHVLRETLRSHGYRVLTAMDALEAEALLQKHAVELTLLDVQLPGESGLSLWQRIKVAQPKLRALLISGNSPDDELQAELNSRAAFLPKPFRADMLLRAVDALLAKAQR